MNEVRELHQLVHTLSYGDAISSEVLALQRCFRNLGFKSDIFSLNTHPKLKGKALPWGEFPGNFRGEVLLHYSLGSPLNDLYRSLRNAARGLIYHNLTPPEWFEGVNPRIVRDIEHGLEELPELCRVSDRLISDSRFNAGELKKLGFESSVLELPIDPEKWNIDSNPGIASLLKSDPGIHVLHVGRLAPNKCVEDIIKSFYFLHRFIDKKSKLWLVGIDIDTELYSFSLKRLADGLGIGYAVQFVGCMDDTELKALYENASVYMCMSEHEGFCLPVVEAMSFGLPVISFASSALIDTVGDGGILVKEKKHPELAELMNEIYRNSELRDSLKKAGFERVKAHSFARFEDRVRELFVSGAVEPQLKQISSF